MTTPTLILRGCVLYVNGVASFTFNSGSEAFAEMMALDYRANYFAGSWGFWRPSP